MTNEARFYNHAVTRYELAAKLDDAAAALAPEHDGTLDAWLREESPYVRRLRSAAATARRIAKAHDAKARWAYAQHSGVVCMSDLDA